MTTTIPWSPFDKSTQQHLDHLNSAAATRAADVGPPTPRAPRGSWNVGSLLSGELLRLIWSTLPSTNSTA